eukprot:gene20201-22177_t
MAAKKRHYALDRMKILSEEFIALPKLVKITLVIAIFGIGLSCISLWLQFSNASLLRKSETKHRSFVNRITNAGLGLEDFTRRGRRFGQQKKRSIDDEISTDEHNQSDLSQCRYRQKTEWMFYDATDESSDAENGITVEFSAAEGHAISTASCSSNNANTKHLQQSIAATNDNRLYQCICKGVAKEENNDEVLGYERLTCTANYWECPMN